ncbi:hypothetical protein ABBQ38_001085 [Trebouxia sp. C0009 RCD-2024]
MTSPQAQTERKCNVIDDTGGNFEAEPCTDNLSEGLWMSLKDMGVLCMLLVAAGFALTAVSFSVLWLGFYGRLPAILLGLPLSLMFYALCFWWLVDQFIPLPPFLAMLDWCFNLVKFVGRRSFISGMLPTGMRHLELHLQPFGPDPQLRGCGSAAGPASSLALNDSIFNYSPALHDGPAEHSPTQAVFIAGHVPPAELSEPATMGHHAHHHQTNMQPSQGSLAAPAPPAVVPGYSFTNAVLATTSPALVLPPVQPVTPALISNPFPQTIPPHAAGSSTSDSSTSTTKINKAAAGDCSAAALDQTTASSPYLTAAKIPSSTAAAAPHPCASLTEFAFSMTSAQSVAQSQDTIPAIHHVLQQQQQQEIPKRPSKDNLFVARREGFTDIKKRGRRTEEEKARGVQRSPDSLLMKWGQHPSQLVSSAQVSRVPAPTPIIAQSAIAPQPLTTAGSSSDRKERNFTPTHGKSAKSNKPKEYTQKMRHRLVKCRKLLAPCKLLGSCFGKTNSSNMKPSE